MTWCPLPFQKCRLLDWVICVLRKPVEIPDKGNSTVHPEQKKLKLLENFLVVPSLPSNFLQLALVLLRVKTCFHACTQVMNVVSAGKWRQVCRGRLWFKKALNWTGWGLIYGSSCLWTQVTLVGQVGNLMSRALVLTLDNCFEITCISSMIWLVSVGLLTTTTSRAWEICRWGKLSFVSSQFL